MARLGSGEKMLAVQSFLFALDEKADILTGMSLQRILA